MSAYNKFQVFSKDLVNGKHNFSSDTFKVLLTNTAPVNTNAVKGDLTEISAGNGYSAGGPASAMTVSTASGVAKITGADATITASGGTIGPFRYAVLYNDTQSSPAKPLVAWWDYGASLTLQDGESIRIDFDDTNGIATVT